MGEYSRQKDFGLGPMTDCAPPMTITIKDCKGACPGKGATPSQTSSACSRASSDVSNSQSSAPMSQDEITSVIQEVIAEDSISDSMTIDNSLLCPEDEFILEHYLEGKDSIVLPHFSDNLKRAYNDILKKIYFYYLKSGELPEKDNKSCYISIIRGILSDSSCKKVFGNENNPHSNGYAIDFKILAISSSKIFSDISNGKISLERCEVILNNDGSLHVAFYPDNSDLIIRDFSRKPLY